MQEMSMCHVDRDTQQAVSFAGAPLDHYRHICAFFNSCDEKHRILDPFVLDGLQRGEKISLIVDPAMRSENVRYFRQLGLDMPRLLGLGEFQLRTWPETHLKDGQFNPDAMLMLAGEIMSTNRSTRMRMISDMGWAVDQKDSTDLIEYEARANTLIAEHRHIVICVYDTAKFGGDVVINVLRTHPMVLIGGVVQMNPFFVPPEQFLDELRQREQSGPGA